MTCSLTQAPQSKIASRLFDQQNHHEKKKQEDLSKLHLRIVDTKTLDEFEGSADFSADHFGKLQQWISKKRFHVSPGESGDDQARMEVGDMFEFGLAKKPKSDLVKIQEEVEKLRSERVEIDKEMKLMQHYFFTHWRETAREGIRGTPITMAEQLYYCLSATGAVDAPKELLVETQEREVDGLMSALDDFSQSALSSTAPKPAKHGS